MKFNETLVKELRSGTEAETVTPYNPAQSTAAGADLPAYAYEYIYIYIIINARPVP